MAKPARAPSSAARAAAIDLPFAVELDTEARVARRVADGAPLDLGGQMRGGVTTARVQASKLDRYHHRGQISDRQHAAGLKFHELWTRASIQFRTTSLYDEKRGERPTGAGGDVNQLESAYDARGHIDRVLERTGLALRLDPQENLKLTEEQVIVHPARGPLRIQPAGWVAIDVCGFDEWAGGTRRLIMLRNALRLLADYWHIEDEM